MVHASKLCAESQGGRTFPYNFRRSLATEELVYSPLSRKQHSLETFEARPEHSIGHESQVLVFVDLQLPSVSQPTFEHFDSIRFSIRNHPTMLHLQERRVLKTQRTHTVVRAQCVPGLLRMHYHALYKSVWMLCKSAHKALADMRIRFVMRRLAYSAFSTRSSSAWAVGV